MPDDKIVQDGYLLKEEPEPEVGPGPWPPSAQWDLVRPTRIRQGVGRQGREQTLPAASFSLWAQRLISLSRCAWQPPHYSAAV